MPSKKTIAHCMAVTIALPLVLGAAHAQDAPASPPQGSGTQAQQIPPPTIDTNNDGKPDAWDRDADGKPDVWDTNGDGTPDAIDNNGDGKPD